MPAMFCSHSQQRVCALCEASQLQLCTVGGQARRSADIGADRASADIGKRHIQTCTDVTVRLHLLPGV
jgi:hypothetical protein